MTPSLHCGQPSPAPQGGPSWIVRLLLFFHSERQKHLANGWAWRPEETQVTVKSINHNFKVLLAPLKRFYCLVTMPGPGEPLLRSSHPDKAGVEVTLSCLTEGRNKTGVTKCVTHTWEGWSSQSHPCYSSTSRQARQTKGVCKSLRGMAQKLNILFQRVPKSSLVCCARKNMTLLFLHSVNKVCYLCHTYFTNALLSSWTSRISRILWCCNIHSFPSHCRNLISDSAC